MSKNVWKKREPVCQIAELKIDWSNNEFKAQIKVMQSLS